MKRVTSKISSLLLALVLAAGLMPSVSQAVFADETAKTYPVWVGGVNVTDENKDDILGDGGKAKYDPAASTLTLNRPEIKGKHEATGAKIYAENKDLTVSGSASLKDGKYGIYVKGGSLTIAGDVTAEGSGKDSIGIYSNKDITFKSGTVTAKGEKNGICADGKITVSDGVKKVTAEGKTAAMAAKELPAASDKIELKGPDADKDAKTAASAESNKTVKPMMADGDDDNGGEGGGSDGEGKEGEGKEGEGTEYKVFITVKEGKGTVSADPGSGAAGTEVKLTATPEDGFEFDKWDVVSGEVEIKDDAFTIGEADVAIDAYFKEKATSFTVTYESNGGSKVKAQEDIPAGKTATEPKDPTRDGYTFKGWFSDKELTKAFDFETPINEDITLYAKWEENKYTVTFESNGGSEVKAQEDIAAGKTAVEPKDPTRKGYTFKGWFSDKELTKAFDFSTPINEDIALYAKWAKNETKPATYKVTFNTNGGSAVKAQTVESGKTATKPKNPTRSGYTFAGWYADSKFSKTFDFKTPITANTTVYAKWTKNAAKKTTCTITYNLNGGTLSGKTGTVKVSVTKGTKITLPKPTRSGYTFSYWEGSRYNAGASYTVNADHTFKAVWKKNSTSTTKKTTTNTTGKSNKVTNNPKTGDNSHVIIWGIVAAAALAGLFIALRKRNRS